MPCDFVNKFGENCTVYYLESHLQGEKLFPSKRGFIHMPELKASKHAYVCNVYLREYIRELGTVLSVWWLNYS